MWSGANDGYSHGAVHCFDHLLYELTLTGNWLSRTLSQVRNESKANWNLAIELGRMPS